MRQIEPIAVAQQMTGFSKQKLLRLAKNDNTLPIAFIGGRHVCFPQKMSEWLEAQRDRRHMNFKQSASREGGGVHALPDAIAAADAADDIRFILRTGCEPQGRPWRNAATLLGDAPADVAVGLALLPGASWGAVVRQLEKFLSLPAGKKNVSMTYVAKRLNDYFAENSDALVDEVLS